MGVLKTTVAALALSMAAIGGGGAFADGGRPDRCRDDHDHRAHASNYYDFYEQDRYSRAGGYRASGVSLSISVGDDGRDRYDRYDDRRDGYGDRYDDRYDDRRGGYGDRYDGRGDRGRVVSRKTIDTRWRANIILVEEVTRGGRRGGRDLVCTATVRGPEARRVPDGYVRNVARRHCSRGADIRVFA